MKRVFCIGNGESRKGVNLDTLKPHGKIYGCNALYRDYTPDVLIAVDQGIIHEIYHSGYAYNNECYFRNWHLHDESIFNLTVYGTEDKEMIDFIKSLNLLTVNKKGNSTKFAMGGPALHQFAKQIFLKTKLKIVRLDNHSEITLEKPIIVKIIIDISNSEDILMIIENK